MNRHLLLITAIAASLQASNILNSPTVDASQFRVTQFAAGLSLPNSMIKAPDGSLLAVISPGFSTSQVVRFQDLNSDGFADGPATVLYSNALGGAGTQIRQAGKLLYIGEFGTSSITALAPGTLSSDPLSAVGALQFQYPAGHAHPTAGLAVRPTPGSPGSVDLIFNIGSQFNDGLSIDPVVVGGFGLAPTPLQGDSLYMLTINESGSTPQASNLRQIATGIRNVYGLAFDPISGDLVFADNAIDEANVTATSEPFMADELNRIPAALLGQSILKFGYPNCYQAYRTNVTVEISAGDCNGVTQSLINFHPVPNNPGGFRSEGPAEIAFAPALFPSLFRNGIFVGFSGGVGPGGLNNQNALVFVDSNFSQLIHFIESGTPRVGNILGVYSTEDSLFIADWGGSSIYQITAVSQIPEPVTAFLLTSGLGLVYCGRRKRQKNNTR